MISELVDKELLCSRAWFEIERLVDIEIAVKFRQIYINPEQLKEIGDELKDWANSFTAAPEQFCLGTRWNEAVALARANGDVS